MKKTTRQELDVSVNNDLNRIKEISDKIGQANGIAELDENGKVPSSQLNVDTSNLATKEEFETHKNDDTSHITTAERNTWNGKANVSDIPTLNNTVTSTSTSEAATANAVKLAYDRADAAFMQANDIKTKWANVVGNPLVSSDTQAQLESKTQTLKNTLATSLTNKGQSSVGTESLQALIDKIADISVGKGVAYGSIIPPNQYEQNITITGLSFKPFFVLAFAYSGSWMMYCEDSSKFPNVGMFSSTESDTIVSFNGNDITIGRDAMIPQLTYKWIAVGK